MSLVQPLFKGKLDIVGDIHGEYEAFLSLLKNMGYDEDGNHLENRKLVFVGDFCDRGPDSPAVIKLVKKLIDNGNAQAILGNHELNVLQKKPKEGSGWFFKERKATDKSYEPFNVVKEDEEELIYDFLAGLPLALENDELRIVHATWNSQKVDEVRNVPLGQVAPAYIKLEKEIDESITDSGLLARYDEEQKVWEKELIDPLATMPFLEATCNYNLAHQMNNPMRVLTSGVEQKGNNPFYASGKWRFVERFTWWEDYQENIPVVVGHFWRKMNPVEDHERDENVFANIAPTSWHGANHNVFCVDFSVGGRFKERLHGIEPGENTFLAALRWPENTLILENGDVLATTHFKQINKKNKP